MGRTAQLSEALARAEAAEAEVRELRRRAERAEHLVDLADDLRVEEQISLHDALARAERAEAALREIVDLRHQDSCYDIARDYIAATPTEEPEP